MKQMKLKTGLFFAVVILLNFMESAKAQGNLVINGSFDTSVNGWTVLNGAGWDSGKGNPGGCAGLSGNKNPGIITQTINGLTLGVSYTVSGDYISLGSPTGNGLGVSIDGNSYFYEGSVDDWESFSFTFTATSASVDLSLLSQQNGTSDTFRVDNISVVAVPEPSSLSLLGMGGAAGLFFLRRKGSLVRR